VENLSHEHTADVSAEGLSVGGHAAAKETVRPKQAAADGFGEEASPPAGLWRKIEAQLRREGVIH
jgi:hypothetical protein